MSRERAGCGCSLSHYFTSSTCLPAGGFPWKATPRYEFLFNAANLSDLSSTTQVLNSVRLNRNLFGAMLTTLKWANAAGLVKSQAQFEDVYGLDSEVSSILRSNVTLLHERMIRSCLRWCRDP
jgi:hypothetical protein